MNMVSDPMLTMLPLLSVVADATQETTIEVDGKEVKPLLAKTPEELYRFWQLGLSVIALYRGQIVGHVAIEPLDETGEWYELGAVWVAMQFRGRHIGLRMYQALLQRHGHLKILSTTVTPAAMAVALHAGLKPISFGGLSECAQRLTCVCPINKTGVPREENVPKCRQRDTSCFAQVNQAAWCSLEMPELLPLPIGGTTRGDVPIPDDDIVILLAG